MTSVTSHIADPPPPFPCHKLSNSARPLPPELDILYGQPLITNLTESLRMDPTADVYD